MRLRVFLCAFSIGGACFPGASIGADRLPPVSSDYVLKVWEKGDGLPGNEVTSIAQSADGYLWIATTDGLARFDGVQFTSFTHENTPGLASNLLFVVEADKNGDLWIGLDRGGVTRMRDGRFETIVPRDAALGITTASLAKDRAGAFWFGWCPTPQVLRWGGGKLTRFTGGQLPPGNAAFVHAGTDGAIWISTNDGCAVFDGRRFFPIDPAGGGDLRMTAARGGGMWAIRGRQLLRYRADGSREFLAGMDWLGRGSEVNALCEDPEGNLWIGTQSLGLIRFYRGLFSRVPTSSPDVQTIAADREGNVWVGTRGGGMNRLRPNYFSLKQTRDGLQNDDVYSLGLDQAGRLWVAGRAESLVRATDSTNRFFAPVPMAEKRGVFSLCPDSRGGVWFATMQGLRSWRDGVFEKFVPFQALTEVFADRTGGVWGASISGPLLRLEDGGLRQISGGGLTQPRAVAEDGEGRIWVGTEGGRVFRQTPGGGFSPVFLPGAKPGEPVRFLVPDGDAVWIGTFRGGLHRWRAGRVSRVPRTPDFPLDDVRALVLGADEDLWLGNAYGLYRVKRRDLDASIDEGRPLREVTAYGRDDGLPGLRVAYGFRNSTARTSDGHLWFATSRGALEIFPHAAPRTAPLLPVLIERVQVDGTELGPEAQRGFALPPRPGVLEIRYTVPRMIAPEQLRFRYRLRGLSAGWTEAGDQRVVNFSSLPPGAYTFEVAAALGEGAWSPVTSLPFTLSAAWWQTGAAYAGAIGLGILAVAWLVRSIVLRRVRARMRRLEQEHALERERARIARDMHDELGASLTRLALMSDVATAEFDDARAAGQQLGEIARTARAMSGTLDEIVWTVDPGKDTLEHLVSYLGEFAQDYLAAAGLRVDLGFPANVPAIPIPSDVRRSVLLALKEALTNVIKHAHAQVVTLRVAVEAGTLRIAIADDGKGFEEGRVSRSANGLMNMSRRMEVLGGSASVEGRPGAGTTIVFRIPLAR